MSAGVPVNLDMTKYAFESGVKLDRHRRDDFSIECHTGNRLAIEILSKVVYGK